jgi:predicted nicotinamide N-methyase
MRRVAVFDVPVTEALESAHTRCTTIWEWLRR